MRHKVIIVGSGFSGICMGIKLKEAGIQDFIILEKAKSLGGTWRENTYPGAECDIPSALYSYSFVSYPDWEYKWSLQPQILSYLEICAEEYGIISHIHFEQEVTSTSWQESKSWQVSTTTDTFESQHVVFATGQLHHPSTPSWPGQGLYEGPTWHSAKWNHDVDLSDKRVGVIGNAASAIQFIPEIAKEVKELTIFQRSANWILPKQDRLYKDWEKTLVRKLPFLLKIYRFRIWMLGGGLFFMMKGDRTPIRSLYQYLTKRYIRKEIKDEDLQQKLIPKFRMGAKRVLFSDTYYQALAKSHVHLTDARISSWTTKGLMTDDDQEHVLDVIICATGFQTQPLLDKLDITGRDGLHLRKYWKEGPKNYLGMTMSNFPNLFLMYGPNTNLGHNSIIIMSEAQANYIIQCISELDRQQKNQIEVKPNSIDVYYHRIQERLKKMIWSSIEGSWYQNKQGVQTLNWPGRTWEYIRRTKKVDFREYVLS